MASDLEKSNSDVEPETEQRKEKEHGEDDQSQGNFFGNYAVWTTRQELKSAHTDIVNRGYSLSQTRNHGP
jgi:hypothetical protein